MYFIDSKGNPNSIPIAFTDLAAPDPFVVVATGRCPFRLRDWIDLADILELLMR